MEVAVFLQTPLPSIEDECRMFRREVGGQTMTLNLPSMSLRCLRLKLGSLDLCRRQACNALP